MGSQHPRHIVTSENRLWHIASKDQGTSVIDVEGTETQRLKNQAALQLLQTWRTDDAQEQTETWMVIKKALEEDRLSDRSLFQ